MLLDRGFQDVREMEGGFTAWQKAGYPVISTPAQDSTSTTSTYKLRLGFDVGDTVVDFRLRDLNGAEVALFELLGDKPVMLEFGSYT